MNVIQGELLSRGAYTVLYKNALHAFYVVAKVLVLTLRQFLTTKNEELIVGFCRMMA